MAALLLVPALVLLLASVAAALHDLQSEEALAELLSTPPPSPTEETVAGRRWALLPEFGYAPDTGPEIGAKYTHRNILGTGATLDVESSIALNRQEVVDVSLATPHLGGSERFVASVHLLFERDQKRRFFGLGNNSVGPDPASTHEIETEGGFFLLGWRPVPRLALNLTADIRHVHIGRGDRFDSETPFTVEAFPQLPGIDGGQVFPLGASVVWDTYDDVVRPTRGWRAIAKVVHSLGDFDFTREVVDLAYLHPLHGGRHVLAVRADVAAIQGTNRDVPFWELEALGGGDTLRGYFPDRFLGTSRVLVTLEWRALITQFNFRDWWLVRLDGVVFGETGRVDIARDRLRDALAGSTVPHGGDDDIRSGGGVGLRIALSEALVARVDVGFSEEEQALVYLAFGQTF